MAAPGLVPRRVDDLPLLLREAAPEQEDHVSAARVDDADDLVREPRRRLAQKYGITRKQQTQNISLTKSINRK